MFLDRYEVEINRDQTVLNLLVKGQKEKLEKSFDTVVRT